LADEKFALGCDVGATKVSISLGRKAGWIDDRIVDTTQRMRRPDELVSEVHTIIEKILKKNGLEISGCMGLGVAFAGFVKNAEGVIVAAPNLEGWNNTPLGAMLEERLGVPVRVENDANVGALGEFRHGGIADGRDFMYVTLSTGIGAGIIINGRPYEGVYHVAGELGHTTVMPDGPRCNCGKTGCLETVSSGLAVERIANDRLKREETSLRKRAVENNGRIDARTVFEEARNGDMLSMEIVDNACKYLGLALSNVSMLLSFSSVIIGGGMAKEGEFLRKRVEHYMRKDIAKGPNEQMELHISKKPSEVVDLGALELVFEDQVRDSEARRVDGTTPYQMKPRFKK
jgi:glucokinase